MEPEKWQNREEKILRRGGEGGQDLGRGDGNHIPHPDHALHPLRELLDDLDAVESLAKKDKKISEGFTLIIKISPGGNVSEREADVQVRVTECKSVAEM